MTNHSETTGPSENSDITAGRGEISLDAPAFDEHQVTLRSPAELADALPYLLGYRPEDSIVLVALNDLDGRGRFGGRARLGIPANPDDWPSAARQLVHGLVAGGERRGARPGQMVAYLCQEPAPGEPGRQVMERLRALAHELRVQCGNLDVPVVEALCISDGRFWSYCCDNEVCCPAEGIPMGLPGTSVVAAAATYAGIQVRGTLRELRARLLPKENAAALEQEVALDTAGMAMVSRILDDASRADVAEETLRLAERVMARFAAAPPASGTLTADLRDDELLGPDEAATLILGLQDRTTRDRAAEWMEADEAGPALRLWRALARRCVGPYSEHAAAPLTLAGWVAWSTGDELEAREAFAMALGADADYLFARLLHQACNEGLDPESLRRCLRAERADRGRRQANGADSMEDTDGTDGTDGTAGTDGPVGTDAGPDTETATESRRAAEPGPAPAPGRRRQRARTASATKSRHRTAHGTRPRGSRPRPSGKASEQRRETRPGGVRGGSGATEGEG